MILLVVTAIISSIRSNMRQLDRKQQPQFAKILHIIKTMALTRTLSELAAESK